MGDRRIYFPRLLQHQAPAEVIWLNAVRTKLAAEAYQCSEPVLLLLGESLDFYYRSFRTDGCWNLSAKSPQLLHNLSASLGMYLEEFHTEQLDRLCEEVRKTLSLCWLPTIELPAAALGDAADGYPAVPDMLLLVTGHSTDGEALIVLHPERSEYVTLSRTVLTQAGQTPSALPLREGRTGWRWMLLNSPSPIRPVFPPLARSLGQALQGWAHRFLHTRDLGGGVGQTGRAAFRHCIADLRRLAEEGAGVDPGALAARLQAVTAGEFGPAWGRDLQARGLREAREILGCDLHDAAGLYDQLAVRWTDFTRLMLAGGGVAAPAVYREAACRMEAIAMLEEQAARSVLEGLPQQQTFRVPVGL